MRFVVNPDFPQEIERQIEFRAGKIRITEEAEKVAKGIARAEAFDEGDYKDGIKTVFQGPNVYLSGTDYKSHWIEWGSVNNRPPVMTLRRAVRQIGLNLDEDPRGHTRKTRHTAFGPIKGFSSQTFRNVPA